MTFVSSLFFVRRASFLVLASLFVLASLVFDFFFVVVNSASFLVLASLVFDFFFLVNRASLLHLRTLIVHESRGLRGLRTLVVDESRSLRGLRTLVLMLVVNPFHLFSLLARFFVLLVFVVFVDTSPALLSHLCLESAHGAVSEWSAFFTAKVLDAFQVLAPRAIFLAIHVVVVDRKNNEHNKKKGDKKGDNKKLKLKIKKRPRFFKLNHFFCLL